MEDDPETDSTRYGVKCNLQFLLLIRLLAANADSCRYHHPAGCTANTGYAPQVADIKGLPQMWNMVGKALGTWFRACWITDRSESPIETFCFSSPHQNTPPLLCFSDAPHFRLTDFTMPSRQRDHGKQ